MEKINFKEVVDVCNNFIKSSGNDDGKMTELKSNLIIRSYLPLEEKSICLVKAFMDADKDISIPTPFISIAFDLSLLFDCLLAYTNIDIEEIENSEKIYENYDSIYFSGLADYIISYCEKDYGRLIKMADRMMSLEHVSALLTSVEGVDGEAINDLTKAIIDLKKNGDKEMIHDMAIIAKSSDPEFANIKEKVSEEVLDEILSKN